MQSPNRQRGYAKLRKPPEEVLRKRRRKDAQSRARHRAQRRAYQKVYSRTHPEVMQHAAKARRARKALAPVCDMTRQQWRDLKAAYGYCCAYCGEKFERLTMDHVIPLSKGGSHTLSNIVPACRSCNCRKATKLLQPPFHQLRLIG